MEISVKHSTLMHALHIGFHCILITWKTKTTWNSIQNYIIICYHYMLKFLFLIMLRKFYSLYWNYNFLSRNTLFITFRNSYFPTQTLLISNIVKVSSVYPAVLVNPLLGKVVKEAVDTYIMVNVTLPELPFFLQDDPYLCQQYLHCYVLKY